MRNFDELYIFPQFVLMQTLGVCVTGADLTIGEYHFDQLLRNE